MSHNFTWLAWEFVNNAAARKRYLKSDPDCPGPVPPPYTAPAAHSKQADALRSGSARAINKEIRKEWPAAAVAPPLVKGHPRPSWPSRP
jgi:hypothetical protein